MNHETNDFLVNQTFNKLLTKYQLIGDGRDWSAIDSEATGIGLVVINFQSLERTISFFIAGKLLELGDGSNDATYQSLVHKVSFANLVRLTKILATNKQYEHREDLDGALNMALRAEGLRNSIVHSTWLSGSGMRVKVAVDNKFKIGFRSEELGPADLLAIAKRTNEIDRFILTLYFSTPGGWEDLTQSESNNKQ